jgi:hypothetical protein
MFAYVGRNATGDTVQGRTFVTLKNDQKLTQGVIEHVEGNIFGLTNVSIIGIFPLED